MTSPALGEHGLQILAPTLFVIAGALVVLLIDALAAARRRRALRAEDGGAAGAAMDGASSPPVSPESDARMGIILSVVATVSIALAMWVASSMFGEAGQRLLPTENPMLASDRFSIVAIGLVGAAAIISVWLSITYLQALHINHGEYYAFLLLSTAGMTVMVGSVSLLTVFLGLELMMLPLYALAGFDRLKLRSNEASLKLFLTGALTTALMLYGMALLYGATGHIDFAGIRQGFDPTSRLAMAGLTLVLAGFAVRVAAPPFHQWAPDVFEGAPAPIAGFVSVAVKVAAFALLLRFLMGVAPDLSGELRPVFRTLAVLAIVVGNLMALVQTHVKRMLAYSGIAHAGYLLIAVVAGTQTAYAAALFYLFAYIFVNAGAFAVVVSLAQGGRESEAISDYAGLASTRPGLAAVTSLFMLALAGVPGTAGFAARFELFSAAVEADEVGLVVLAAVASAASLFYYLKLPLAMYTPSSTEGRRVEFGSNEFVVLVLCAALTLYFGFSFGHGAFDQAIAALR